MRTVWRLLGKEHPGELFQTFVMLLARTIENALDMGPQLRLAPAVTRSEFGASQVSLVPAFDESPGGCLVEPGVVAFGEDVGRVAALRVFIDECSGHDRWLIMSLTADKP